MNKGDFIRVHYTGRLESGEIFDITDEDAARAEKVHTDGVRYGAVPVIVGAGFLIPALDRVLETMAAGETRHVRVEPSDGFGERNPELVRTVPMSVFEGRVTPKPGLIVDFSGMRGRIQSVSSGRARVDFNNPLAGKVLEYDLTVVGTIDGDENKITAVLEFFGALSMHTAIDDGVATIEGTVPEGVRKQASALITKHVSGITNVRFVDAYPAVP